MQNFIQNKKICAYICSHMRIIFIESVKKGSILLYFYQKLPCSHAPEGTRTIICGFIKSTFLYISLCKTMGAWSEISMHECAEKHKKKRGINAPLLL